MTLTMLDPRPLALLVGLMLLIGCSSESSESAPVPVALTGRLDASDKLSDSEVTDFLTMVKELPGGRFPEFQPVGIPPVQPGQEPEIAVVAWRDAYRRSCDPASLASSWHEDAELVAVLSRRGYSPAQFANLARRISLAITASSLEGRIDFAAAHRQVEQQIGEMSHAIHQLDVVPDLSLSEPERLRRREAMMHALQETAALGEFLRMLAEVPQESQVIAQRRRTDLRPFMPARPGEMAQFERIFEMDAQVVPAANWQPQ